MEQQKKRGGFFYMVGPLLLFWVIEWIGSSLVSLWLAGPKLMEIVNEYANVRTLSSAQMTAIQSQLSSIMVEVAKVIYSHSAEFTAFLGLLTLPFMWMFFRKDRKNDALEHRIMNVKAPTKDYALLLILGAMVCVAMNNLENMCMLAFKLTDSYASTAEGYYTSSFPIQIACLGLIVPIVEEMLFRGVLFNRYRRNGNFLIAAIYSSLLFAVSHSNMVQAVFTMVVGMLMAYAYEKYGSVKAPIFLHIVINVTSLTVTQLGGFSWMFGDFLRLGLITVGCVFVAAIMFVLVQKIEEKPQIIVENKENISDN